MPRLIAALDDPDVAAVQGYYTSSADATRCARAMGLDLEQRYAAIGGRETGHVCTGNAVYRAAALHRVGLFDESFGYGYDNDMSYRLRDAGYRLAFCREARSVHRWRDGFGGYLAQQYGFGYGRLDLVAKHPRRLSGDSVSPAAMMAHPLLMAAALASGLAAAVAGYADAAWQPWALGAAVVLTSLAAERLAAGIRAARRFGDATALLFVPLHLARDIVWVAAMVMWTGRRLARHVPQPAHSMRPRAKGTALRLHRNPGAREGAVLPRRLGLIPTYNEAANLTAVVGQVRALQPDLDILVVDDGSTDGTSVLLPQLGVRWLRFPARLGIGSAMRAGLRYAVRLEYDVVVRLDGDGQHDVGEIEDLLAPLGEGADVVLGSRYTAGHRSSAPTPILKGALAFCLSRLTGRRVTDPTSGFCAFGRRAIAILAEHHPTGYPEPELQLFLSRNALAVVEVPVSDRPRLNGTTSLTAGRATAAGARVLLAMIVVPLRGRVAGPL
jgi:hypothetical protein